MEVLVIFFPRLQAHRGPLFPPRGVGSLRGDRQVRVAGDGGWNALSALDKEGVKARLSSRVRY